jgi:peptidoglycan/xylan/chitin deacetylase (PgdA/CDA1 family)
MGLSVIARAALALAARERLSILIFHRVLPAPDSLLPGEPSADQFDALLRHLERRFTVLPLREGLARTLDRTLPARALAITFDDGYADNVSIAAPLLRAHGMPATIFIATGYLDGGWMFNDIVIEAFRSTPAPEIDLGSLGLGRYKLESTKERRVAIDHVLQELKYSPRRDADAREILRLAQITLPASPMLTREALRRVAGDGIDIGAHTVSHPILARVADEHAWREIRDGKRELERLVERPVTLFAYPNGKPGQDYSEAHVRMVREAGFDGAVSTRWGAATASSDRFQLPRFTPWTRSPWKFDLLMMRNLRGAFEGVPCG